jgi:hypothetical protein
MSIQTPSSPTPRWQVILRISVASLFCLLVLAITIPDLGRSELSTHTISYGWRDGFCIAMIITPLILILVGAACSRIAEVIGWILMVILLALRFSL